MKIKSGDTVLIIKGKDRGKKSKVLKSFPKESKILIEGANLKKKHQRPKREGEKGTVVEVAASLPSSSVKLVCPKCGKPARIGYRSENKMKYRICKKCGGEL